MEQPATVRDYRAVFAAVPVPCLLLDRSLRILDANQAFVRLLARDRDDLLGRRLFDAFPEPPGEPASGQGVRDSVAVAFATGVTDRVPLMKYDIEVVPGSGRFAERWWTIANIPVPIGGHPVQAVVNAVEDVTAVVLERERSRRDRDAAESLRARTQALEADLFARSRELTAISAAEALASRRLAGLAQAALDLAAAGSLDDLLDVVVGRGLAALGADGGAVAVRDDSRGTVALTLTASLGESAQRELAELPLDGPLPASVAARSGEPVLLRDRDAGLAFHPGMARFYADGGTAAWASLPLRAGNRLLGSLSATWDEPQQFSPTEVELMAAFAAQCAQALDRLLVRQAEQRAATATRRLSEALQRSLLTTPQPQPGLQLAVRYLPAAQEAQVGGDWYDAFGFGDGLTSVVVGDVAGHDRDAAAGMAQVRNVLRGVAHVCREPPAVVLGALDRALRDLCVDALATAVLAQVEPPGDEPGRVLRWCNAGHPPPMLLLPDGDVELLARPPDMLLGIDPAAARTDHRVLLPPGSTVLLYTDGLVERRDAPLQQGLDWLADALSGLAGSPLEELCDRVLRGLEGRVDDDVALLALRVEPDVLVVPPEPAAIRRARGFVRERCRAAAVADEVTDVVTLLTSEVVTNAVLHGRSEARLVLHAGPGRIRVEVGDRSHAHPRALRVADDADSGRGMAIVAALAARWGVHDAPDGKVVWFEVSAA